MEIQYDKLNKIESGYNDVISLLTPEICCYIDIDASPSPEKSFTNEEEEMLFKVDGDIMKVLPERLIDNEIYSEIMLNMACIEGDGHLKRYLSFIRIKVDTVCELISSITDFHEYKLKYWGDVVSEGNKERGFYHKTQMIISNPATNLRVGYLRLVELILNLRDYIDEQINPDKKVQTLKRIDYTLKDDLIEEWKHVIPDPQRRLYFDKWLGKFSEVQNKIYHSKDIIERINSSSYNFGGGNAIYDKFIEWASNISSIDLPDQVITHEIMNEIDLNMLELKTKREKDLYLTKLSDALRSFSDTFLRFTKTHPEYLPREEELNYNEKTSETCYVETQKEVPVKPWRILNSERKKHTLQLYYVHLLVEIEILNKIVDYADDLRSPIESINILDNEVVSNSHKLLLFHKIGLFEPLYDKYYQHLGAVKFTKLIATLLGVAPDKHNGFRPSVNGLIKEIIKPTAKKVVQTDLAEAKVSAFLAEIGLIMR